MRPSNKSRSRNKSNNNNGNNGQRRSAGNVINRVFDSSGPDGKVRGTPQQIIDKYNLLARDAQLSGDRVAGENHLQHAEHYNRLLGEALRQQQEQRQQQDQQRDEQQQQREERSQRDGQRNDDGQPQQKQQHQPQPQQDSPQATGSGLTTIDPREDDSASGPVDTPESRGERPTQRAVPHYQNGDAGSSQTPVSSDVQVPPVPNGSESTAGQDVPADATAEAPAKKPRRPRAPRKPRAPKENTDTAAPVTE